MAEQQAIPKDIEAILEYIALAAKGYNNNLKWNEVAKLKSDMMKNIDRWRLATPTQVKEKCLDLGMTNEDANEIANMLQKRIQGRKLVPHKSYRDFEFKHESPEDD